jgi:hypothetical protein
MGNHYHLLLETPRGNLSKVLHHINGESVKKLDFIIVTSQAKLKLAGGAV